MRYASFSHLRIEKSLSTDVVFAKVDAKPPQNARRWCRAGWAGRSFQATLNRLERVAFDDRLEHRRTADHLEKGTVLLFNQIDAPLAPRRDHHLATQIEDLLDEFARPHVDQLLREHRRCKICRSVVAVITLGPDDGQARHEA
jgi:hypothetical protein